LAIRLNKIQALTSFKVAIATKNAPFEFERNLIGTGAKELKLHQRPKQSTERMVYNYSKGYFVGLLNCLQNASLVDLVRNNCDDINVAWSEWKAAFLTAADSFIPKTSFKCSFTPPYITKDLLHATNMKESLRRNAKA
jgi:hypothetical protein